MELIDIGGPLKESQISWNRKQISSAVKLNQIPSTELDDFDQRVSDGMTTRYLDDLQARYPNADALELTNPLGLHQLI